MSRLSGLGSRYWSEVIEVLRAIVPVYDRVNRVISLGKDEKYRHHAISGRVTRGNMVLDAGSGFGNMSKVALAEAGGDARIVMYDPIPEMLANARNVFGAAHPSLSSGIFERMPFRDDMFDAVMCGYSLRDAIDLEQAISEMHRVLRPGGRLIIVDLGKPDSALKRWMVATYLKHFLGISAYFVAGRAGLKFKTLYGTFLRWPKNSRLEEMLRAKFSRVVFDKGMLDGAIMVAAYK